MSRRRGSRRGGSATVNIHVRELAQFFNSLDPSPFRDRDLDREAALFIEEEFREKRAADLWHLNVHVREGGAVVADDLQSAVQNYYGRLVNSARHDLREHLRLGQLALLGGIAIFLTSMGLRQLLQGAVQVVPRMLDEGLIILAWLALWRPTEVLVYEWVPLYRKRRLYERLAGIRVSIRSEPDAHAKPTGAQQAVPG
jgi:predicted NodU family carbamoyl transferase